MDLPFGLCYPHEEFGVLDGNPTSQNFHYVLKVGFQNYIAHAIYESSRGGVEHVQALSKGAGVFLRAFCRSGRRSAWGVLRIAKKHKNIPDTELGWKGDRVVEKG